MNCTLKKVGVVCFLSVFVLPFVPLQFVYSAEPSNRSLSFVTEALEFNSQKYVVGESSESAYATYFNDTYVLMNVTDCTIESQTSSLIVSCAYFSKGQGLWFVTLIINRLSAELPICAQPSANAIDRARDFLERYKDWTGNTSLTDVIGMLDTVDITKNMTTTINQWNMTVNSCPYFVSFYWEYALNGTGYRGLGITILGKYVFFRDDRNLPFLPQKPPETIFTSYYPSGLGIISPDENSTNVPLNTNITLFTTRPVGMMELYLNPEAKIANLTSETVQFSGRYTYRLAEPLQPNTKYTATVLYGQATPPDFDSAPMSMKSWSFTTGDSIEAGEPSSPESCYPSPFPWAALSAVIAGAGIAIVITGYLILRKKRQSKPPKSNS